MILEHIAGPAEDLQVCTRCERVLNDWGLYPFKEGEQVWETETTLTNKRPEEGYSMECMNKIVFIDQVGNVYGSTHVPPR